MSKKISTTNKFSSLNQPKSKLQKASLIRRKIVIDELQFPGSNRTYTFDFNDFEPIFPYNLGSEENIIKKFKYKPTGHILAVKFITIAKSTNTTNAITIKLREQELTRLKREYEVIRTISSSPDIVDFYGFCTYETEALICMNFMDCSLKDLYNWIHLTQEPIYWANGLFEKFVGYIAVSIVDALVYCKEQDVMHRDIKPSNILLNCEGKVQLGEFGESRFVEPFASTYKAGSVFYRAPERFINEPYDERSDIWSLAITLLEMASGQLPYNSKQTGELAKFIEANEIIPNINGSEILEEFINSDKNIFSERCLNFLSKCLQTKEDRATCDQLREHEFYKAYNHQRKTRTSFISQYVQDFNNTIELDLTNFKESTTDQSYESPTIVMHKSKVTVMHESKSKSKETNATESLKGVKDIVMSKAQHIQNLFKELQKFKEIFIELNNNFDKLKKLDPSNDNRIDQLGKEIFELFYELDLLKQTRSLKTLCRNKLEAKILNCDLKLTIFIYGFDSHVSSNFGYGEQFETLEICMIRTGIKTFMELFAHIFEKSPHLSKWMANEGEVIEELDETIKNWHIHNYSLDGVNMPEKFTNMDINLRNEYWWWFPPNKEKVYKEFDDRFRPSGFFSKICCYLQELIEDYCY